MNQYSLPRATGYHHAIELQEQINNFNKGIFVDGSEMKVTNTPFSYGVACYPEKHEEAPNIESDLFWLKKKVEAGAEYAVTQLFYDNKKYFEFVEQAKAAGINVPIIPGIKPFKKLSQLSMVPKTFKVDLPEDLVKEALKCKNDKEAEQGWYRMVRRPMQRVNGTWSAKHPLLLHRSSGQYQRSG